MRRFTTSDVPAAREIDRLAFPATDQYQQEFYECVAASDDFDAIVATEDDNVVGWALLDLTRRPIRIRSVSVHPECRRRGFGSALIVELLRKRGVPADLVVKPSNLEAIALYRKLRFKDADADPELPQHQRMTWHPINIED